MSEDFKNTIIINNLLYLINKNNTKIGELETKCGVTPGYISKLSKDSSSKPSIEFIANVAKYYHLTIDLLITFDLSSRSPSEEFINNFLYKLLDDTFHNKLEWEKELSTDLNNLEARHDGSTSHPLFYQKTFYMNGESEYPEMVTRTTFNSNSYGLNTYIEGSCYNLRLKNNTRIYIMKISKDCYKVSDTKAHRIEAWLWSYDGGKQFLCDNLENQRLSNLLNSLYLVIDDYFKHPIINSKLKKAVDAYMSNDMNDDPDWASQEDEFPFY